MGIKKQTTITGDSLWWRVLTEQREFDINTDIIKMTAFLKKWMDKSGDNEELKKFCDSFYSIGIKTNTLIDDSKYFDKKTALQKEKYLQALNQRDIAVQEYKKMKKKLETIKKQVEHLKIPFTDEKTK